MSRYATETHPGWIVRTFPINKILGVCFTQDTLYRPLLVVRVTTVVAFTAIANSHSGSWRPVSILSVVTIEFRRVRLLPKHHVQAIGVGEMLDNMAGVKWECRFNTQVKLIRAALIRDTYNFQFWETSNTSPNNAKVTWKRVNARRDGRTDSETASRDNAYRL